MLVSIGLLLGLDQLRSLEWPRQLDWVRAVLDPLPGWLILGSIFFAVFAGFFTLLDKRIREKQPDVRRRLQLLAAGLGAGLSPLGALELWAGFTSRTMGDAPEAVLIPSLLMLFLVPVTLSYVLVVDRALDVGVVLRQGLQYAFARRSVDALRVALSLAFALTVVNFGNRLGDWPQRTALALACVAALFAAEPLLQRLRLWIDRRFFREAVDAELVLTDLAARVRTLVEPDQLTATVCATIGKAMHVSSVRLVAPGEPAPAELRLPVAASGTLLGELALGPKRSEEPYSKSDLRLLETVAAQTGLALENARLTAHIAEQAAQRERLQREIEIAREVQSRLLPKNKPPVAGLDYDGWCRPAQQIGGDYFDYLPSPSGATAFVVGDIAGKGIPAALLMANLQAALRGLTLAGTADVPELMARLNQLIFEATPANRFATFFYTLWEPARRELVYCSAGHNPALLRPTAGPIQWLRTPGLALGLRRTAHYECGRIRLNPNDTLVLYTDGVTEAQTASREEFGEHRLAACIEQANGAPPAALRERIVHAVDTFAAGHPQHDDITVLVLTAR